MIKRRAGILIKNTIKTCWQQNLSIPGSLIKNYKKLGLCDSELVFILQVLYYSEIEGNLFPSIRLLCDNMGVSENEIMDIMQRLTNSAYLKIDESYDNMNDVHYEVYNFDNLFDQLAELVIKDQSLLEKIDNMYSDEKVLQKKANTPESAIKPNDTKELDAANEYLNTWRDKDIFTIFEHEFMRTLSAIEYEKICKWIEEDSYDKEIIIEALRNAVLNGKFSMTYIDRILLEWKKNNIRTLNEVKRYTEEFLERKQKKAPTKSRNSRSEKPAPKNREHLTFLDKLNQDAKEGR